VLDAGTAGPADPARALALHERACAAGVAEACLQLGERLWAGGEATRGRAAIEESCSLGSGAGCVAAAEGEPDRGRAARLIERACDLGAGAGCLRSADASSNGRRVELLRRACRLGDGEGCARAAAESGPGDAERPSLLERGCALGCAEACARLGLALLDAGSPDRDRGRKLLAEGCATLGPAECLAAAEAYLGGPAGVASLAEEASPALLEEACRRGHEPACARLGRLLQEGIRLPADGRRAAELYGRACASGVLAACTDLGVLHRFGAGVSRDEARAQVLLDRACRAGRTEACRLRDDPVRPLP
jgi:hypothetical protein